MSESVSYRLWVNDTEHEVTEGWLGESLLHVLRERLGLPGSKSACEQGECGSCSVMVDDILLCSCLVLAAAAVGRDVRTVEAYRAEDGQLSDVQRAFVDEGAVQCGFCTPGLIVAVHDLLDRCPAPDDLTVREAISGNLCRCTGYGRIFEAVRRAQAARNGQHPGGPVGGETALGAGRAGDAVSGEHLSNDGAAGEGLDG